MTTEVCGFILRSKSASRIFTRRERLGRIRALACRVLGRLRVWVVNKSKGDSRSLAGHPPAMLRISSAMLVRDNPTSSANGAFGQYEPQCPLLLRWCWSR
jgi:hypothetical protein